MRGAERPPAPEPIIDYITRSHPISRFQAAISLRVRRRIYDWFLSAIDGVAGKTLLDHGSTPDTSVADSNCFIRWLLADGANLFAASPESIEHLAKSFPGLRILPWPVVGGVTPQFDAAVSSAVLEHVGSNALQEVYVTELLSLGKSVLLTTPNRGHWLEFHTKLPLVHWMPKERHRKILGRLGMHFWAQEENLNLLTREELEQMIEDAASNLGVRVTTQWFEPRFLGRVSNLCVVISRRG